MTNTETEFVKLLIVDSVVIVTKGLPYSGKSVIAKAIGEWAKCPVLYIDTFLDTLSMAKGYKISEESKVEVHQLAMDALYKEALRHLRFQRDGDDRQCVVIKSRLCSTFEFEKLIQFAKDHLLSTDKRYWPKMHIVILECRIRNEHRWRGRMEMINKRLRLNEEWYKASKWNDIEMAMDYTKLLDDQFNCDDYLLGSIEDFTRRFPKLGIRVSRLVLDPFDDLNSHPHDNLLELTPTFRDAITYLLREWKYDCNVNNRRPVVIVQYFVELRRYLLEKKLRSSINRTRTESVCVTNKRNCVFKLCSDSEDSGRCGVCDLDICTTDYYICHFCNLTIHKSCAEKFQAEKTSAHWSTRPDFRTRIACNSCKERRKRFTMHCKSCIFETILKDSVYPIIINHEGHPEHALSVDINFPNKYESYCKACGLSIQKYNFNYGCYICQLYYHQGCALLPTQVEEHEHGGYKHTMKLMYSHHGMEDEHDKSYWCEVCYEDIDPQLWFYSCQSCLYYTAHPKCVVPH